MSERLLERHPGARLRVYVLWVNRLAGDSRSQWDGGGLTDRRVVHLWDGEDVAGRWFARHQPGYQGPDWDLYLLFGPDAEWTAGPPRLRSAGAPVIDSTGRLDRDIGPLLAGTS